jgi:YD repeat-containing protein
MPKQCLSVLMRASMPARHLGHAETSQLIGASNQDTASSAQLASNAFSYDPAGNSLDRVTAINESATLRTEFAYDGLGRRVQIIERSSGAISSEQNFVYDGWALAEQRDTGNSVVRRYFAQGEQRATTAASGNYFYTFDHLGSVREMLDNTGAVRARYEYDAWGNRTKSSGDLDCDFGFTSYWYHPTSGLYLSPTRLYSSAFGRGGYCGNT